MSTKGVILMSLFVASSACAEEVTITGEVQSKCVIVTDTAGTYGNPNAYTLTTAPSDGGVLPVVRYDVSLGNAYLARITHPTAFSTAPSLTDVPTFTGSTEVQAVSDATNMGSYETNKFEYSNVTEYDLTATGSTWFKTNSTVTMGGNKAFASGTYRAVVQAECIAQ